MLIVDLCLNVFLFTSLQTDLVPEFGNSFTLYKLSLYYLTKPSDDPVVYMIECSIRSSVLVTNMESVFERFFYILCRSVRKHVDRHI